MDHKARVLDSLISAFDLMMEGLPAVEVIESGLFDAWLDQTGTALGAGGMELERQMWESLRSIQVSLNGPKAVQAYGTGMRAVLLGMLHYEESREQVP